MKKKKTTTKKKVDAQEQEKLNYLQKFKREKILLFEHISIIQGKGKLFIPIERQLMNEIGINAVSSFLFDKYGNDFMKYCYEEILQSRKEATQQAADAVAKVNQNENKKEKQCNEEGKTKANRKRQAENKATKKIQKNKQG